MTPVVSVSTEATRVPIARSEVERIAREVLKGGKAKDAMVSIAFVSRAVIARLNQKHLGKRGATDVIAFGFRAAGSKRGPVIGDVYIAPAVVRENARKLGEPIKQELRRVVIHGVLHVLGHDHPEVDRARSAMWRRQERMLGRLTGAAAR